MNSFDLGRSESMRNPAESAISFGPKKPEENAICEPGDERNTSLQLKLACPKCAAWGMATIESLDHLFHCRRCRQWYRMVGTSFVAVERPTEVVDLQVRMAFSDWKGDRYREKLPVAAARTFGKWLFRCKYRVAVTIAILVATIFLTIGRFQPATAAKSAELPTALEDRVPLWINAWLSGDAARVMQLSACSYDRQMRKWLACNRPPSDLQKSEIGLKSVKPRGGAHACGSATDVTAEVRTLDRSGKSKTFLVRQSWASAGGTWYFVPPLPTPRIRR